MKRSVPGWRRLAWLALMISSVCGRPAAAQQERKPTDETHEPVKLVGFDVRLQTVLKHDDGKWLWFHPRLTAIGGQGARPSAVVMTLQRHLQVSDFYSGLFVMRSDDFGQTWSPPDARAELDWRRESDDVQVGVADVTPGWHAPSGKLIAIGVTVRYDGEGRHLYDKPRSHEAAYTVHDPATGTWSPWKTIDMPDTEQKFYLVVPGCVQWLVEQDGSILLPVYFKGPTGAKYTSTVLRCAFDGETLKYLEHGSEMTIDTGRGLYEPSLARFRGRYYLTLRADERAYAATSTDGLHYEPAVPWQFDDAAELGSENTQQHWLVHSDGLFLTYTRRGADNDHIFRHRAPLFLAQVDPERLAVIRRSERVLVPERGATLGNFGAATIDRRESWVTVAEGIWNDDARRRGAEGAVFLARVIWSRTNRLAEGPESD